MGRNRKWKQRQYHKKNSDKKKKIDGSVPHLTRVIEKKADSEEVAVRKPSVHDFLTGKTMIALMTFLGLLVAVGGVYLVKYYYEKDSKAEGADKIHILPFKNIALSHVIILPFGPVESQNDKVSRQLHAKFLSKKRGILESRISQTYFTRTHENIFKIGDENNGDLVIWRVDSIKNTNLTVIKNFKFSDKLLSALDIFIPRIEVNLLDEIDYVYDFTLALVALQNNDYDGALKLLQKHSLAVKNEDPYFDHLAFIITCY